MKQSLYHPYVLATPLKRRDDGLCFSQQKQWVYDEVYYFSKLKLRIRLVTFTKICQLYPLHPVMPADSITWPNGLFVFFIMQANYMLSCLCTYFVVHIHIIYTKYMKNFKMNLRDRSETKNGNIKPLNIYSSHKLRRVDTALE